MENEQKQRARDIELLTISEAAAVLRVSKRTVYNYIKSGELKAIHYNQRVTRIPADALKAFIAPQE